MPWRSRTVLGASRVTRSLRGLSSNLLGSPARPERNPAACRLPWLQNQQAEVVADRFLRPVKDRSLDLADDLARRQLRHRRQQAGKAIEAEHPPLAPDVGGS